MTFLIYRIYYGDTVVYVGQTKQKLINRLRQHFWAAPQYGKFNLQLVTKVEYAECKTVCDMNVYEVYYMNLLVCPLNQKDKKYGELTIRLPELEWSEYKHPLINKWRQEGR